MDVDRHADMPSTNGDYFAQNLEVSCRVVSVITLYRLLRSRFPHEHLELLLPYILLLEYITVRGNRSRCPWLLVMQAYKYNEFIL